MMVLIRIIPNRNDKKQQLFSRDCNFESKTTLFNNYQDITTKTNNNIQHTIPLSTFTFMVKRGIFIEKQLHANKK